MTTRSLWVGIKVENLEYEKEGRGFLELLCTGVIVTTDSSETLQRICEDGVLIGFGQIVEQAFAGRQILPNEFQGIGNRVRAAFGEQGVNGQICITDNSVHLPQKIAV